MRRRTDSAITGRVPSGRVPFALCSTLYTKPFGDFWGLKRKNLRIFSEFYQAALRASADPAVWSEFARSRICPAHQLIWPSSAWMASPSVRAPFSSTFPMKTLQRSPVLLQLLRLCMEGA